jgi:GTP pyrophosphokinase
LAAHWKYKGQKADDGLDSWLNKIREVLETPETDNANLIDNVKLSLYSQEIFVFTPKGDLRRLPKGATVLDFAYDIHSDVGDTCVGARVNGKNVPIRYVLNNGDKVEVISSKNQKPKTDWLDFVVTSKAKAKIKVALKDEKLQEAENGKEIFKRRTRNWKIPFNDLLVSKLLKYFKLKNSSDFYAMIAKEEIDMAEVKRAIHETDKPESQIPEKIGEVPIEKIIPAFTGKTEEVLEIDEKILKNVEFKLSKCCNPIFGDDIFGFVTISDGIKIHRINCPNAKQMIERFGYRVVKAKWAGTDSKSFFQAGIKLSGGDEIGILSKVSDIIAKDLKVNLRSINVDTIDGNFEGVITLFVKDVNHLDVLIHKLLKVKGVNAAIRVETR